MICSSKSILRLFLGSVLVPLDGCSGEFMVQSDCVFGCYGGMTRL